jgi:hypothetical protein
MFDRQKFNAFFDGPDSPPSEPAAVPANESRL